MFQRSVVLCFMLLLALCAPVWAQEYNHVGIDQFKGWLEANRPMHIVDIQPERDFKKQHFPDAIQTGAYPVETDAQRAALDKAVEACGRQQRDVVIVSPRGKMAAQRTYEYLTSKGIPAQQLFILVGGMGSWPYGELVLKEGCG